MLTTPTAILFDLDDTIITEGTRATTLLLVAEHFQSKIAPLTPIHVADAVEEALQDFWTSPLSKTARLEAGGLGALRAREMVVRQVFESLSIPDAASKAVSFAAEFSRLRSEGLSMYTDALHTLTTLRMANIRLGLITNGAADIQRAKIKRFDLAKLFDCIVIEGKHGCGKPDARVYNHALSVLNVHPGDTWMVGDNLEWEVAAPQRFGMVGIWHDHRGTGLPANCAIRPDLIIRRPSDLLLALAA